MYAIRSYYVSTVVSGERVEEHLQVVSGLKPEPVITSYSIHYTKLYDELSGSAAMKPSSNKASARRWVVKIGSALLTDEGRGLDQAAIRRWVDQMAALRKIGCTSSIDRKADGAAVKVERPSSRSP